jgi:hypothetical protein
MNKHKLLNIRSEFTRRLEVRLSYCVGFSSKEVQDYWRGKRI